MKTDTSFRTHVLRSVSASFIFGIISVLTFELNEASYLTTQSYILTITAQTLIIIAVCWQDEKQISMKFLTLCLFFISFAGSIDGMIGNLLGSLRLSVSLNQMQFTIVSALLNSSMFYLFLKLFLVRLDFEPSVRYLFKTEFSSILALIVSLLLYCTFNYSYFIVSESNMLGPMNIFVLSIALMIVVIILLNRYRFVIEAIASQESILLQQTLYSQSLEAIQSEMRMLQHDTKNMMSALYLNAFEGGYEAIETQLNTSIHEFETVLSRKINQTQQIANIQILQVKHLILEKIMDFQDNNIPLDLIVEEPIVQAPMDAKELLMCLNVVFERILSESKELEKGRSCTVEIIQHSGLEFLLSHHRDPLGFIQDGETDDWRLFSNILKRNKNSIYTVRYEGIRVIQNLNIRKEVL